jgi:hypothetical protein
LLAKNRHPFIARLLCQLGTFNAVRFCFSCMNIPISPAEDLTCHFDSSPCPTKRNLDSTHTQ